MLISAALAYWLVNKIGRPNIAELWIIFRTFWKEDSDNCGKLRSKRPRWNPPTSLFRLKCLILKFTSYFCYGASILGLYEGSLKLKLEVKLLILEK